MGTVTSADLLRVVAIDWAHPDAVTLRRAMATEIQALYPDPDRPSPRVPVDPATIVHTAVAYLDSTPVGHVALRRHDGEIEIKRMYVTPTARRRGVATALLADVGRAARAAGAQRIVLHTGDRQPEAVAFYRRHGYDPIPAFPPYDTLPGYCFARPLD